MRGLADVNGHAGAELLSPELEVALRAHVMRRKLAKHEVLFTYGSSPEALFCVERGRMRFSVTAANGREAVLSVLEPGQWFGEVSLFMDAPRVYDARAVVDCEVLMVPARAFHAIVDHHPAFLMEFTRLICRRYRWALEWIDETILQPFVVGMRKCRQDRVEVLPDLVGKVIANHAFAKRAQVCTRGCGRHRSLRRTLVRGTAVRYWMAVLRGDYRHGSRRRLSWIGVSVLAYWNVRKLIPISRLS
ncbi:hypothetical protein LMG31506_06420 [Cupriavidus yeoncheonensis]|uniref:Cyclic nucleotide-binding domain-containing protein n=1 Tax=Cupriavidus yeoncheonensis TaxID=1462994 RepID=A0A916MYQ2_9BURK|nr:Crp/Fnr family transcriptional regulator [Cupriavidus yeoncheonensis]CAG2158570.1 hypothetical protein LMG31506_06420 [Cupriavidus yeoncheonensis]